MQEQGEDEQEKMDKTDEEKKSEISKIEVNHSIHKSDEQMGEFLDSLSTTRLEEQERLIEMKMKEISQL